ncbi:uncharacterized protein LOC125016569 [Mugil cephalus]|uniref:uncharacterized protein LOC125016569 n=1 Tax=Mugil cephalus TaxID=48193 RepID=UPI001FB71E37|nr:uncharacterized protein LOC125016569 [Mugil cephalus]
MFWTERRVKPRKAADMRTGERGSVESMDPSEPGGLHLSGTSEVSLHDRFSRVLQDQLTWSRKVTSDPVLHQRTCDRVGPAGRLQWTRDGPSSSVWMRLGWRTVSRRRSSSGPRGFWSFRNKYRWRARGRPGRQRLQRTPLRRRTAGWRLEGGATASRGCGRNKDKAPTKKQLDAQLDKYMSLSKSRLDRELDRYMSMSRRHLDAQLDDYMAMAGQSQLDWDSETLGL